MSEPATWFAFDNPWEVIALIGVIVGLRVAVPRVSAFDRWRAGLLEFVDSALIAALLVFCLLRPFVIQAFFIPSGSMEPTLLEGDRILVNKFIYFFRPPADGDIMVFNAPPQATDGNKDFIKRVVGTPGDRLQVRRDRPGIEEGGLIRNGQLQQEPYIAERPDYGWPAPMGEYMLFPGEGVRFVEPGDEITVPDGYLVAMGDNRNNSNDSHRWAVPDRANSHMVAEPFVPRENVLGKAMVVFWPPQRIRLLH
ncbi:MAG TPA: signal peptidase I [Armatimonadota bacterium]|nr:signal peptidase I [Armatimonadota bacterium]